MLEEIPEVVVHKVRFNFNKVINAVKHSCYRPSRVDMEVNVHVSVALGRFSSSYTKTASRSVRFSKN